MSDVAPQTRPSRTLASVLARAPWWFRLALGLASALLGLVLITRPTTSLGTLALLIGAGFVVSGVVELVARGASAASTGDDVAPVRRAGTALAIAWIAAGLFVLLFLGLTVRLVALVVGIALVVRGVVMIARGFARGLTWDARVAEFALGVAAVVFGVLALTWPDITLLIVAVVFGAWLIAVGLLAAWRALRWRGADAPPAQPGSAKRGVAGRWVRTIGALAAIVLASGAAWLSASLQDGSPVVDDFYAAPRTVPDEPGQIIRSEPFTREIPDDATAWRILYTTTRGDGSPAVGSAIVVVPADASRPVPVINWSHGTTGFARQCAPSLLAEPFESGALFVAPDIIDHGWALVAADYIGLGTEGPHPYLIGPDTGHAVLDASRAARQLEGASLSDQNVVWGHSQGGAGALWAGAVADAYAPELEIGGVVALAPAGNLPGLVENLPHVLGGSVFASFVVAAYSQEYEDVTYREYVRPGAEATLREMATRCLGEPGSFASLLSVVAMSRDPEFAARSLTDGAFGARLSQNVPPPTITAPLLLGQGADDSLVTAAAQDDFVAGLCEAGVVVDYRHYAGKNHVPLVEPDSPAIAQVFAWTQARLAGEAVPAVCTEAAY